MDGTPLETLQERVFGLLGPFKRGRLTGERLDWASSLQDNRAWLEALASLAEAALQKAASNEEHARAVLADIGVMRQASREAEAASLEQQRVAHHRQLLAAEAGKESAARITELNAQLRDLRAQLSSERLKRERTELELSRSRDECARLREQCRTRLARRAAGSQAGVLSSSSAAPVAEKSHVSSAAVGVLEARCRALAGEKEELAAALHAAQAQVKVAAQAVEHCVQHTQSVLDSVGGVVLMSMECAGTSDHDAATVSLADAFEVAKHALEEMTGKPITEGKLPVLDLDKCREAIASAGGGAQWVARGWEDAIVESVQDVSSAVVRRAAEVEAECAAVVAECRTKWCAELRLDGTPHLPILKRVNEALSEQLLAALLAVEHLQGVLKSAALQEPVVAEAAHTPPRTHQSTQAITPFSQGGPSPESQRVLEMILESPVDTAPVDSIPAPQTAPSMTLVVSAATAAAAAAAAAAVESSSSSWQLPERLKQRLDRRGGVKPKVPPPSLSGAENARIGKASRTTARPGARTGRRVLGSMVNH
jgi:hypothetical protein